VQKILNDSEIRPQNLMKVESNLLLDDLHKLSKLEQVKVDCPACKSSKYDHLFTKIHFNFVICKKCSTVFVNPRPSANSLEKFYTYSKFIDYWNKIFKETANIRKDKIFKPRMELVKKIIHENKIKNCNVLMEVGSGHGWFCELAKNQKLAKKIIAIEPSPMFAESCRKIHGIEVIESTIEKYFKMNKMKTSADLIVNFELIAHLFDPKSFLRYCYKTLKKGGMLILSTPNYYGFDIQILQDKSDYISPHFLNYFNPDSIALLLHSLGFRNIKVITPGLMDVNIVLNKIKNGQLNTRNQPFLKMILEQGNDEFVKDFQFLLQKHNLSSHMMISACK
jgi:2-polyprenyl-3-methyl-5-hydroxy-6-metoxy-1,4-benzoquinol methylase